MALMVPRQIRLDHVTPGLQGRLTGHACDPGLRDHDVEFAEFGHAALKCRVQLTGVTNIGLGAHDATSGLLDEFRGLL